MNGCANKLWRVPRKRSSLLTATVSFGGVEAALDPRTQGQSAEEAAVSMQKREMAAYYVEPFRHGYECGQARQQAMREQHHRESIDPSV
jgi:hypothetical protein